MLNRVVVLVALLSSLGMLIVLEARSSAGAWTACSLSLCAPASLLARRRRIPL